MHTHLTHIYIIIGYDQGPYHSSTEGFGSELTTFQSVAYLEVKPSTQKL